MKAKEKKKQGKREQIIKAVLLLALVIMVLAAVSYQRRESRQQEYRDCLEETAFTLNGEAVPMKRLAYYIMCEERMIEEQAQIYNPGNTRDYWNLHINGVFIQEDAKKTVMEMAIHDELFYRMAVEAGVTLDEEEEEQLRFSEEDFWMDLLEEQTERIPVPREVISEQIRRKALAEKYQGRLAQEKERSFAAYQWDGYDYEQMKEQQEIKINEKVWKHISVGNITLQHGLPNYINGYQEDHNQEDDNQDNNQ